ncbi:MAG: hypothetical protein K2O91_20325 [Lachnospiraceae bacterium]|nr:hypothetical protein [Lachnospiraceae bacterium]
MGDLEDFFAFGYIASKCEKNSISELKEPRDYYEREVAPEIQKLATLFRFLGNADVPFAVFEQLKFFVQNHIVEGRVDLSEDALDSIILNLKNYIKGLGNIREWICNEIQNESVDIEELYLYITGIVISEAQPLIVEHDNIENDIRYVFEMYMKNKFQEDFPL